MVSELESLTGMLMAGDITPLVYELLKDSPYKEDILKYKELIDKELVKKLHVDKEEIQTEEPNVVFESFDDWMRRFV